MVTTGLFVRLRALPGKETEVEHFLKSIFSLVQAEPATTAWFAVRLSESEFALFDAFPDYAGRQAHLGGAVADALKERGEELFVQPLTIERLDVLASKLF